MIGKFGHRLNCSIPHFVPQGEHADGMPVIIFPKKTHQAAPDVLYDFDWELTANATYTIDGLKYRVGHAYALSTTDEKGDEVDGIVYAPSDRGGLKLGDRIDPTVRDKLMALAGRR